MCVDAARSIVHDLNLVWRISVYPPWQVFRFEIPLKVSIAKNRCSPVRVIRRVSMVQNSHNFQIRVRKVFGSNSDNVFELNLIVLMTNSIFANIRRRVV